MSKPNTQGRQRRSARQTANVSAGTRIDAPHQMSDQEAVVDSPAGEAVPCEAVAEQVRIQASQLASHLRTRQEELDHREAQVNARMADLERDLRAARLWLREREAGLTRHSEELDKRQRELEGHLARLAAAEAAEPSRPDANGDALRREAELETRAKQLAEQATAQRQAQQKLEADRQRAEAALQYERQKLEARYEASQQMIRQMLAAVERRRQAVQRRSEQVGRRRAALEEARAELARMYREALEIRLATRQLWDELCDAAPAGAMHDSLDRIRAELDDQYRLAKADLQRQRDELEGIRGQLAEQHEKLLLQKVQFEQWAARRQKETEQQAARLIAREEELQRRETGLQGQLLCSSKQAEPVPPQAKAAS